MLAKASLPDWIAAAAAVVACYVAYDALVASTRAWVGPLKPRPQSLKTARLR